MATKPKRSTKVVKSAVKPKPATTKKPAPKKPAASKKSALSKKFKANQAFWNRTPFLFYSVLVAAALVAILIGLMGYQAVKKSKYPVSATATNGVLFLQALGSDGSHKTGDTVEVTLYEDSGNQSVNALQAGVKYPAEKLEVVGVKTGDAFPQEAATDTATPGLLRVARSIKPGEPTVKGAKPVVTVQFKVLVDSPDPFELTIDDTSSLLVRSTDNKNILGTGQNNKFEL